MFYQRVYARKKHNIGASRYKPFRLAIDLLLWRRRSDTENSSSAVGKAVRGARSSTHQTETNNPLADPPSHARGRRRRRGGASRECEWTARTIVLGSGEGARTHTVFRSRRMDPPAVRSTTTCPFVVRVSRPSVGLGRGRSTSIGGTAGGSR